MRVTVGEYRENNRAGREEFPSALFFATDEAWEIYDEDSRDNFLNAISHRETLDSFIVSTPRPSPRELELRFTESEAKILYKGNPDDENWFEHFLSDLKKSILPPTFRQLAVYAASSGGNRFDLTLVFQYSIPINIRVETPYCKIVIQQRPPNQFVENVKANLVSNIIWAVITFALGVVATLVMQNFLHK